MGRDLKQKREEGKREEREMLGENREWEQVFGEGEVEARRNKL